MALHLVLLLLLDEIRFHSRPDRVTVLNVHLASSSPMPPPQMIPNLFSDRFTEMETGLRGWMHPPVDLRSHDVVPLDETRPVEAPPPVMSSTDHYYKSSELDEQPKPVRSISPVYPPDAKANGTEGMVKLLLLIDEEGKVRQVEVLSSLPAGVFDNAAINALKDMDFIPGQIGMAPVKSRMIIKIDFKVGTDLQ